MNKRRFKRRHVDTDEIPPRGMARNESLGLTVPVNIVDYSNSGLGFWSPEEIKVATELELEFMDPNAKVSVKVAWCRVDDDTGYRGGFSVCDEGSIDDLVEAFDDRFF